MMVVLQCSRARKLSMGEAGKGAPGGEEFVIEQAKMGDDVSSPAARCGTDYRRC